MESNLLLVWGLHVLIYLNLKAEHPSTHQKLAPEAAGLGTDLVSGLLSVLVGLMPRRHHCCS